MQMRTLFALGFLFLQCPVYGHHSFAAEFDSTKPVTLIGVVTRLDWTNPHAHLYLDAKDESGAVTSWALELRSPNVLLREGWTRDLIQPGTVVTVHGFRARNGIPLAVVQDVTLSDGRRILGSRAGVR